MTQKCTASCKDGSDCGNYPIQGEDKCRMHIGKNDDSHDGENNPNYKHGAFSDHLRSDLTESELEAIDDMVDAYENPEEARELIAEQAAEAWLKYKRSGDTRFLREYRQLAETFNLAPNTDKRELSTAEGEDGIGTTIVLDSEYVDDE